MNLKNATDYDVEEYLNRELLRFTTAGSVDDGKSTLIGRLLFDSKAIFKDQMEALEISSELRGEDGVNLALLTDGLRSEREQGITIDVSYRYFSTPKRKFIIADTPGHEQYTRNMVTGASTADLAIVLIDARNGILTQSKRHGFIASLLGIPHVLVCVNKMDLVDFDKSIYDSIVKEFSAFCEKLDIHDMVFVPISALDGDNVVDSSSRTPWYKGPTVLHHLENVVVSADRNLVDFRFPVQYVLRPNLDFRGFSGRIVSGSIKKGETIMALPSRKTSRVKELVTFDGNPEKAFAGQSVTLTLEDEIDISRGEMIVRKNNVPRIENRFEAILCWMDDDKPMKPGLPYIIQHTTRVTQAYIRDLRYRIDVNTLHRQEDAQSLELNEIGRVVIETAMPLFLDPYKQNRETGSFIIIDPASNKTVGAGMVRYASSNADTAADLLIYQGKSMNTVPEKLPISRESREQRNGHKGHVVWLTGLVRSGKSTVARELSKRLWDQGKQVFVLDGDNVRQGLSGDLNYSEKDRRENVRRVAHTAKMLSDAGQVVLCAFISPRKEMRDFARALCPDGSFTEVWVNCNIEECRRRDDAGLYQQADKGEIPNFTGVSAQYDPPDAPEIVLHTDTETVEDSVDKVLHHLANRL